MKYSDIKIVEALRPSQYRNLVKGWDKKRYAEIFLNPKYKHDKHGYRVYIPIEQPSTPGSQSISPVYKELDKILSDNGYQIVDYIKGIVQNLEKKQQIKIGKVLTKLNRQDLLNKFNTDKSREGTKSHYIVVISRHPYDIAGMSTDRGWTSCMNLHGGANRHYVPLDIKQGSVVAYATTTDDINLKRPSGRLLMKPFVDIFGSPVVHFGIENRVYGTDVPGFRQAVTDWVTEINSTDILNDVAILNFDPTLYPDSELAGQHVIRGKNVTPELLTQFKQLKDNGKLLLSMDNPSEKLQIYGLSRHPQVFYDLMNKEGYVPPESVQRLLVAMDTMYLDILLDNGIKPSETVQLTAVGTDWRAIWKLIEKDIDIPESVAERVIEQHPVVIQALEKRDYKLTKNMLIKGLRSDGGMLDWYFKNDLPVDLDIEVAAVENGYHNIYRLFLRYQEKGKSVPDIIIDKIVNGPYAGASVMEILEHNKNSNSADIIPISEKQILHAMISDNKQDGELYLNISEEFPELVSEPTWIEFLRRTYPTTYKVRRLNKSGLVSDEGIKALLPYNGDLLELARDPTEKEIYAAIKNKPEAISNIRNPSPELQVYAVKLNPNAIGSIENPAIEAFKTAAMYKEKNVNWIDDESGVFDTYAFLTSLLTAMDDNNIPLEIAKKLVKLMITTEPNRITSLIRYNSPDLPADEELQMIAVNTVPTMIDNLFDYEIIPSEGVLIAYAKKYGRLWSIIDKFARINRRRDKKVTLSDGVLLAYLENDKGDRDPNWLLEAMSGSGMPISKRIIDKVLELTPTTITLILEQDLDVTPEQVFDAVRRNGVQDDRVVPFLDAVKKKYDSVPEKLLLDIIKYSSDTDASSLIRFMHVKDWVSKPDNGGDVTERVYKAAIESDYRNIFLIPNADQKLRDYNYDVNGVWMPLATGDLVRLSNPKAPPRFNIEGISGNFYKINVGGDTRKIPKDRIHKANGIERPADYDQKFKLFMKKYPVDAAANYITQHVARNHSSGGSEMLNSQLPDILKKFNISDQKDIDKLRTALKYQSVVLVDQYNTKRQDDDDDDDF